MERLLRIESEASYTPISVAQMYYSLLGRDLEQSCVDLFEDTGLGTMIWSPLAGGFLTGKYRRGVVDEQGRRVTFNMPPINEDLGYSVVDLLERIAAKHQNTIGQIAIAWILAKPWVSSVLIGAAKLDQLDENLGSIGIVLDAEDVSSLDALTKQKTLYPGPGWALSS